MPLSKLVFKPGINREGTNYSNEGGWYDGDKIRFRNGYVERIRGWETINTDIIGTVRKLHEFVTLQSLSLMMVGTEEKVYLEESGSLYDITPYRRTVLLPFEVTGVEGTGVTLPLNTGITIPILLQDIIGEDGPLGTGAVGQVSVSHNSERISVEGLEADGIVANNLLMIEIREETEDGLSASGEIGIVQVFVNGAYFSIFPNVTNLELTPYTDAGTGEVGTVTVTTTEG
jgi:hypothetical protein